MNCSQDIILEIHLLMTKILDKPIALLIPISKTRLLTGMSLAMRFNILYLLFSLRTSCFSKYDAVYSIHNIIGTGAPNIVSRAGQSSTRKQRIRIR